MLRFFPHGGPIVNAVGATVEKGCISSRPLLARASRAWKHAQRTSNRSGPKGGRLGTLALQVGALHLDVHVDLRPRIAPAEAIRELRQTPIRSPPPTTARRKTGRSSSGAVPPACDSLAVSPSACIETHADISLRRNRRPVAFPILPGSQFASFSRVFLDGSCRCYSVTKSVVDSAQADAADPESHAGGTTGRRGCRGVGDCEGRRLSEWVAFEGVARCSRRWLLRGMPIACGSGEIAVRRRAVGVLPRWGTSGYCGSCNSNSGSDEAPS